MFLFLRELWQDVFEYFKHCLVGVLVNIQVLKTLYWLLDFIHNRSTNTETSCATATV